MEELIKALKEVDQADDLVNRSFYKNECWLTNGTEDDIDPRVAKVSELANMYLIANNGQCDWRNHAILKGNGFPVTCGEKDSFGWLTGVIHTSKGMILYG